MDEKDIIIQVYTNASGFLWAMSKIKTAPDVFFSNEFATQAQIDFEIEIELNIGGIMCCDSFDKFAFGWMKLEDGTNCMPYIYGNDNEMMRINNCPSCGKYVRDIMIAP